MGVWATVFLVPAFYLQGGAPAAEFDVSTGVPGQSAARYPGSPRQPSGGTPVEAAAAAPSTTAAPAPTTAPVRVTATVRPTITSSTVAPAARAPSSTTTTEAPPKPATAVAPTTMAPSTTTTTRVVVSLPAVLRPAQQPSVRTEHGVASWFGAPDATCAHRTLPFGTVIKVTMVATGVSTECKVADRGPSDMSRVIDLSTDTFEQLADPSVGLIDVVIEW